MVLRSRFSRPKPNLAAAKKSQSPVKQPISGSEDEKPAAVHRSGAAEAINSQMPCPASLPPLPPPEAAPGPSMPSQEAPETSSVAGPSAGPSPSASPVKAASPGPASPPQPARDPSPARPCAEQDDSPLFVPTPTTEPRAALPAPAAAAAPASRARYVHRTDLDEAYADGEDSEEGNASVVSEGSKKRRSLEDFLMRKEVRKQPTEPRHRPVVRRLGDSDKAPMDRSTVTMRDLIYYTNRSQPPPKYRRQREILQFGKTRCAWYSDGLMEESENVERRQAGPGTESTSAIPDEMPETTATKKEEKEEKKETGGQAQFTLDADGNIVLKEESLLIRRPMNEDDYIDVQENEVIGTATYSSFRKQKPRSKKWSLRETIRLYKALSTVGTDFSFMARIFKYRTREEIKRKFKREEKARPEMIDRVLSNRKHFDLSILDDTSNSEMSNSSSNSDDDGAALDPDNPVPELCGPNGPRFRQSRGRGYRREKRYKQLDIGQVPPNPDWHRSKTSYRQDADRQPSKRRKVDPELVTDVMSEAISNFERSQQPPAGAPEPSTSRQAPSPAPSSASRPASRCGSVEGMQDVLTRLIGQKMRDISERSVLPAAAPPRRSRDLSPPPPAPTVRNRSMSLDDFCKLEANLRL